MTFVAFDVLEVDGASMTDAPWHERREMLESLVPDVPHSPKGERPVRGGLKPSEVSDDIAALYARVCASGGEGIIIKNREAPYEFKRSTFWRKLKTPNHLDDLEVVGLTQGSGTRGETFGSFVLARRDEEGYLRYVCKAGSGLSEADLHRVASAAGVLGTSECPLSEAPALDRPLLTWLRPGIRADVVYERPVKAIGPTPRHPRVRNVTIEA